MPHGMQPQLTLLPQHMVGRPPQLMQQMLGQQMLRPTMQLPPGFLGQVPGGLQMPMGAQMGQMGQMAQMMFPGGNPMIMMPPRFR